MLAGWLARSLQCKEAVTLARQRVADFLGAQPDEI
jgi:hypothetical protein